MGRDPAASSHQAASNVRGRRPIRWVAAAVILALSALLAAAMMDTIRRVSPWWDVGNYMGLGALFTIALCFAVNPRPSLPPLLTPRAALRLHRALGYAATCLVAFHIAAMILAEPLVLSDLTPLAPAGMLTGLGGAILALALLCLSVAPLKPVAHGDAREFRSAHRLLSIAVIVAGTWHAIDARFHIDRMPLVILLAVLGLLLILRPLGRLGHANASGINHVPPVSLLVLAILALIGGLALAAGLLGAKVAP